MIKDMILKKTNQTRTHLKFRTQGSTKQDLLKGIKRIGGGGGLNTNPNYYIKTIRTTSSLFKLPRN